MAVTLLAGFEMAQMFRRKAYTLSVLWIGATILVWEAQAVWPTSAWHEPGTVVVILGTAFWALIQAHKEGFQQDKTRAWIQNPTEQWALTLAGGVYLGLGGAYLIRLRTQPEGLWWTLFTCLSVWIGDTAAYVGGSRWGRHKMAPTISPGKTWEGYAAQIIGGLISGAILGWLGSILTGATTFTLVRGMIVGGVISVLCPAGDFFVSMMKREVQVKDTSHLIPGHGGVLDRMDTIIWACALVYIMINLGI
jgi:phosphatidate cytidylyltransferase